MHLEVHTPNIKESGSAPGPLFIDRTNLGTLLMGYIYNVRSLVETGCVNNDN